MSTRRIAARPATMWGVYIKGHRSRRWSLMTWTLRTRRCDAISTLDAEWGVGDYDWRRRAGRAIALRVDVRPADTEG